MTRGLTLTKREEQRVRVLTELEAGRITRVLAGELLGVSERQVYRLVRRYRGEGPGGLVHGNRGRPSAQRISEDTRQAVQSLARGTYSGANTVHLTELLEEREGIALSRASVDRILKEGGPQKAKRRRSRHRSRRDRMSAEGMLLQVDGSHHDWFLGRGPRPVLLGAIDDATGTVAAARFHPVEDTQGYFLLIEDLLQRHGVPLALYSDKHATFRSTQTSTIAEQLTGKREPTQFGRAMEELGVRIIMAHSPQAKGRVERLWGTLQSRLVTELRLADASTIDEANHFLPTFLERFNHQFAIAPSDDACAYAQPPGDLSAILCTKYVRRVARDNTVRFPSRPEHPLFFQILPGPGRRSYAKEWVELRQYPDDSIAILHDGQTLAFKPLTLSQRMDPKAAAKRHPTTTTPTPPPITVPAQNHPWRKPLKVTKSLST